MPGPGGMPVPGGMQDQPLDLLHALEGTRATPKKHKEVKKREKFAELENEEVKLQYIEKREKLSKLKLQYIVAKLMKSIATVKELQVGHNKGAKKIKKDAVFGLRPVAKKKTTIPRVTCSGQRFPIGYPVLISRDV